jgi:hypothetical protein
MKSLPCSLGSNYVGTNVADPDPHGSTSFCRIWIRTIFVCRKWIRITVKSRIRIRMKVKTRIRIRIKVKIHKEEAQNGTMEAQIYISFMISQIRNCIRIKVKSRIWFPPPQSETSDPHQSEKSDPDCDADPQHLLVTIQSLENNFHGVKNSCKDKLQYCRVQSCTVW